MTMRITRRALLSGAGALAACALLPIPSARAARSLGGLAFGTYWRAVLPPEADAGAVSAAIGGVVRMIDGAMSPYLPGSELSRFNRFDGTDWVAASAPVCEVTRAALAVAGVSGGAFEPTVGPLVHQFGFGPITGDTAGGFADLEVRDGAIRKRRGGLTLDLCGLAKGHALDRMMAAVAALGVEDFLVELGGEVAARGHHPSGRAWQIAIERPGIGAGVQRVCRLDGLCAATSGDGAQFYEFGGRRYGHIIDPATGEPVQGDVASVTVLAPVAMEADAWATALMALPADRAIEFSEAQGLRALFLLRAGDGFIEHSVGGFADHLKG